MLLGEMNHSQAMPCARLASGSGDGCGPPMPETPPPKRPVALPVPPAIEVAYNGAARRIPQRFGTAGGQRSRAREAWERMCERTPGIEDDAHLHSDKDDDDVAIVGYAARDAATRENVHQQLKRLSVSARGTVMKRLPACTGEGRFASRRVSSPPVLDTPPPEAHALPISDPQLLHKYLAAYAAHPTHLSRFW
jgi:hypothetical protein